MRTPRLSRSAAVAARETRSAPKKLVSKIAFASAMETSSTSPHMEKPALLIRASSRPTFSRMNASVCRK
jgi:hypothetical protein